MNFIDNEELGEKYMPNTLAYLKKDLDRLGGDTAYQALLYSLHRFFGGGVDTEVDASMVLMYYNIIFRVRACKKDPDEWSPGNA